MAKVIDPSEPIAVIGLGSIFPKAKDTASYWRNIIDRVDAIDEVPKPLPEEDHP